MKNRIRLLSVLTLACAMLAPSAFAQSFTPEQKEELNQMMKQFVENNPKLIMESVNKFQMEQQAADERKTQESAKENLVKYKDYFADKTLPAAGNLSGDVTVVEYFDYNCGYCKKAFTDVQSLLQTDTNVRVVFQEMPILSQSSHLMARYALAAHKQGKYFDMHMALMQYHGPQSEEGLLDLANKNGLDVEKLKADLKSSDIDQAIETNMKMASELGIRGTPGFIVGDQVYAGYIGIENLQKAIEAARKPATPEPAE